MINNDLQQFLMQQEIKLFSKDCSTPLLAHLPQFGYLKITGEKARTFLQGQFTCDLSSLSPTQSLWGAYLNLKGRVITTLRVFYWQDQIHLQVPSNLLAMIKTKLSKIAQLSRVTLTDVSDELSTLGLLGSITIDLPSTLYGALFDNNITFIKTSAINQTMLIGTPTDLLHFSKKTLIFWGEKLFWDYQQIQQKIVEIDQSTTELFTPHDIALPEHEGVSFTKGCYVGQEIVARMHYRGKLKQHLYQVVFDSTQSLQVGMHLYDANQNAIAQVAAFVVLPDQTQVALVIAKDEAIEKGLLPSP